MRNMRLSILFILIIVNIPIYKYLFKKFFYNVGNFYECIRYSCPSDWDSLRNGDYLNDWFSGMKLLFFGGCCSLIVGIEYFIVVSIIYKFF